MHTADIEKFYSKIDDGINLVKTHTRNKSFSKIIKACRLKPHSIFTNNFNEKKLENFWADEFGNALRFKNKSPYIVLNDIEVCSNAKISTDLFFGNSFEKLSESAKSIIIIEGDASNCICFYGTDEYFRAFNYAFKAERISSLCLGIKLLNEFFNKINFNAICEIDKNIINDCMLQCAVSRCIISPWPTKSNEVGSYIEKLRRRK
jgi:hypothetical protein